ncbi:MAG: helix-turn-helix transcriptional regulator [Pedobacter sp.]|nr:MAG: helix-turn-helix transcriptional regulator [Pedobacter sp.]
MNLIDHNQKLPAGLVDNGVEFFVYQNEIRCLHQGKTYTFENIPAQILEIIKEDMLKNPKALKALADWDITDPDAQFRQYIICRFGGFDQNPDITADGMIIHSEYIECGRRGKCPHEGKLCASIQLKNGILSRRDLEVLKLIGQAKLDKEVCAELFIAEDTLRYHKEQICQKAGIWGKPALAILAHQLNLV